MNDFYTALHYVNRMIYEPNDLIVKSVQEEKQNSKYGAGTFQLSSRTVRFRVANLTPTKAGQFVAFWEKDRNDKNQPYLYEEAPDLFIITTFKNENEFGQFIFSKEVLLERGILKSDLTKYKCQDKYVHFRLFKNVQFGSEIRYQLCSFNRLLNLGLVILLNVIF